MANWYTADTHFGNDSKQVLIRDNRPYKDITEYTEDQVRIWNEQASESDTIYVLGDFCNYFEGLETDYMSGLAVSAKIRANIVLITGNNEERVIDKFFDGDLEKFRSFCLNEPSLKFADVKKNDYVTIEGRRFFLTHKPTDHADDCLTLFGHVHRGVGLYRPYGFNVGVDLNHFRLFGDPDIKMLLKQKKDYWDKDPDCKCNE